MNLKILSGLAVAGLAVFAWSAGTSGRTEAG